MRNQKISFNYRGKKIELEVEVCSSAWSKFRGLMFRRRESAPILLFYFKKSSSIPIHSFFCKEFVAVWLDEKNKVLEIKKVESWKLYVKPEKEFVKLIEIPVNYNYRNIVELFLSHS